MPLIRQLDMLVLIYLKQFLQEDHLFLQTLSFPGHDQCRALPLPSTFIEDRKERNADPDLYSPPKARLR